MFDFLSHKFSSIFSRLTGSGRLTEKNVKESCDTIRESLLEADVPYDLVETFVCSVQKEVDGQRIIGSLKPAEQFIKVVNDKLLAFLGGKEQGAFAFQFPAVVMVMGLQGSGKTTTSAKMARFVQNQAQKRGKKRSVLLGSVDFCRPAAVDQLEVLAKQVGVAFYRAQSVDPVDAAQEIYAQYKTGGYDLLFLDTAGRLHVDNTMLQELCDIDGRLHPRYKLLVLDAMTGQESLNVAKAFDQGVGFGGAILTKMDSDTRGGAAFSFRYALKKPIRFVGTGEKVDDLSSFHPDRVAGRMLGMGDLQSLVERADEKIRKDEQEKAYSSMMSGRMTLLDFANQMDMVGKLGSLSQLIKYMPGMGKGTISQDMIDQGEIEVRQFRAIISSMTPKERLHPRILDALRRERIACGAGVSVSGVNLLLQRFEQVQQYAKLFKSKGFLKRMF